MLEQVEILNCVCKFYHLDKSVIFKKTRKRHICFARQVFFHFCRKYTPFSFENIGLMATDNGTEENYNHATVLHADKKVKGLLDVDRKFKKEYMELDKRLVDVYIKSISINIIPEEVNLLVICEKNTNKNFIGA